MNLGQAQMRKCSKTSAFKQIPTRQRDFFWQAMQLDERNQQMRWVTCRRWWLWSASLAVARPAACPCCSVSMTARHSCRSRWMSLGRWSCWQHIWPAREEFTDFTALCLRYPMLRSWHRLVLWESMELTHLGQFGRWQSLGSFRRIDMQQVDRSAFLGQLIDSTFECTSGTSSQSGQQSSRADRWFKLDRTWHVASLQLVASWPGERAENVFPPEKHGSRLSGHHRFHRFRSWLQMVQSPKRLQFWFLIPKSLYSQILHSYHSYWFILVLYIVIILWLLCAALDDSHASLRLPFWGAHPVCHQRPGEHCFRSGGAKLRAVWKVDPKDSECHRTYRTWCIVAYRYI